MQINDKQTFENVNLAEYSIIRTRCVQNSLEPGTSIDIDLKLLGMFLTADDPSFYIRSYKHRRTPLMEQHGIFTYMPNEAFAFARKNGFQVRIKNVVNSASNAKQTHIVVTDDMAIIEFLSALGYEKEE